MTENISKRIKIICIVLAVVIAFCSVFIGLKYMSKPETYQKTMDTLNSKQARIMTIITLAAGASFLIAAVPDDATTPIADQFANLSSDLIIVLCAIFLERFLVTILGRIAFVALIPLAALLLVLYICIGKSTFGKLAMKFLIVAIGFCLVIPGSVFISDKLESKYEEKYQKTVSLLSLISEPEQDIETPKEEQTKLEVDLGSLRGIWNTIKNGLGFVSQKATETGETIQNALGKLGKTLGNLIDNCKAVATNLIELLAIMIVTSCVVPVLVILFLFWFLKSIFSLEIGISDIRGLVRKANKAAITKVNEKLH